LIYQISETSKMKKHLKLLLPALCCLLVTGCAVRTGILVEVEGLENPLFGEAVATLASGDFSAAAINGFSCYGTYDQYTKSAMLRVSVECNDKRKGQVIVMRTGQALQNGSGEGVLNDGTRFRVLIGDMIHYRGAQGFWDKIKK